MWLQRPELRLTGKLLMRKDVLKEDGSSFTHVSIQGCPRRGPCWGWEVRIGHLQGLFTLKALGFALKIMLSSWRDKHTTCSISLFWAIVMTMACVDGELTGCQACSQWFHHHSSHGQVPVISVTQPRGWDCLNWRSVAEELKGPTRTQVWRLPNPKLVCLPS